MSDKPKIPYIKALEASNEIKQILEASCERIQIVGSVRREKPEVGDIEVLIIPKITTGYIEGEMFPLEINLLEIKVNELIKKGILKFRTKKDGTIANGPKVKLLYFVKYDIPLDLFITDSLCWWCMLVARTGSKDSNANIAKIAKTIGWRWKMGGAGFLCLDKNSSLYGKILVMKSEEEIFEFVGLKYKEPKDRT